MRVFNGRRGVSLATWGGAGDATAVGTYSSVASLTPGTISAGTLVDSYYLHADPVGASQNVGQLEAGEVTFPTNVLGLIVLDPGLSASDAAVGAPGTSYPPGGRALELGSPTDTAILSPNRRTVPLTLPISTPTDDSPSTPAPIPTLTSPPP